VARCLKEVLLARGISQGFFARQVLGGISRATLDDLLNEPQRWQHCSESAKLTYHEIERWTSSEAAIRSLEKKSAESNRAITAWQKQHETSSTGWESLVIDTEKVAKRVNDLLSERDMDRNHFALNYMGISFAHLTRLLYTPTAWHECSDFRKSLYKRLGEWAREKKPSQIEFI
jgi:hypothetical protein